MNDWSGSWLTADARPVVIPRGNPNIAHLSREAAGEEAEKLLAVALDRSSTGSPERRRAVERFGRTVVVGLATAFVADDHAAASRELASIADDVGRTLPSGAAPLVRFLRSSALPPAGLWGALDWRTWKAAGEALYDPGIEAIVRAWAGEPTDDERAAPGRVSTRMSSGAEPSPVKRLRSR